MTTVERIKKTLTHPSTESLDINDPKTTELRRQIIEGNSFLWRIYDEWYRLIANSVPNGPGLVLELGSGAGFLRKYIPELITSEVFEVSGVDVVLDARYLPFASSQVKAITMVDVLHHVPDVQFFLTEAQRCLKPGGVVAMVEPWVSTWSRFIYTHLHHEPFEPGSDWSFPAEGPLSGANGALPWILFERDRAKFEREFPGLEIVAIVPFMPFRYLVSGGVSMRQLMPAFSVGLWKGVESLLQRWPRHWPMFAFIQLRKR